MVTTTAPRAPWKPAWRAAVCPAFRRKRRTRTRGSSAASRRSASPVPSVEPSSTNRTSKGCRGLPGPRPAPGSRARRWPARCRRGSPREGGRCPGRHLRHGRPVPPAQYRIRPAGVGAPRNPYARWRLNTRITRFPRVTRSTTGGSTRANAARTRRSSSWAPSSTYTASQPRRRVGALPEVVLVQPTAQVEIIRGRPARHVEGELAGEPGSGWRPGTCGADPASAPPSIPTARPSSAQPRSRAVGSRRRGRSRWLMAWPTAQKPRATAPAMISSRVWRRHGAAAERWPGAREGDRRSRAPEADTPRRPSSPGPCPAARPRDSPSTGAAKASRNRYGSRAPQEALPDADPQPPARGVAATSGVSKRTWEPRNSARCSSVRPPPRPWLATCRAVTQPVRAFQISTGVEGGQARRGAPGSAPASGGTHRRSGASQR